MEGLEKDLSVNGEKIKALQAMLKKTRQRQDQCRIEMINMIRTIIRLQDDIRAAIELHASSPRLRGNYAPGDKPFATRAKRAQTLTITVTATDPSQS